MYSFGLIVFDMYFPPDATGRFQRLIQVPVRNDVLVPESRVPHLSEVLGVLLTVDGGPRPSARACLTYPFFVAVLDGNRDTGKDLVDCQICLDKFWRDEGIQCTGPERHFTCAACFNGHVVSLNDEPLYKVKDRNGDLTCSGHQCHTPYPPDSFLPIMDKVVILAD